MDKKKALVVDDEIHIVQVVAIKLRNNGFEVMTADNGQKALDVAKDFQPDIVVTDYQMPFMDGVELIESLRQNEDTKQTPVIMLTARGFAIEDERREKLQISDFLSKPFSPRQLLASVEQALGETVKA
ncbi:Transcriptional regulatory protein YycF [Anaerohalosphaera lusitana]|uniref:Transcriptional regulatory protein YycF n=1 Tax=Anaerohalosphaera lusitana TaxID=1936003 RepID=A0A1U9NMF1_9BACT|nr:response regulator [Anaerohalosphaera lusitana]AQT68908.1 Transcriptional regulatory protein YycF [Anaerohalosphaera lusitana]